MLQYMYMSLHVKYPLFLTDFNETRKFLDRFKKFLNIKFHENPSSGNRVVPCGRTDGQTTGVMTLTVAFRSFVNAPESTSSFSDIVFRRYWKHSLST
jgi:hypothetical protein